MVAQYEQGAVGSDLMVEIGEQRIEGVRLAQPFAGKADSVRVSRRRAKLEAQKTRPAQPGASLLPLGASESNQTRICDGLSEAF